MLKKRATSSDLIKGITAPEVPVVGAGADPNAPANSPVGSGDGSSTTTGSNTVVPPSASGPAAANPTNSGNPLSIGQLSIPLLGSATGSSSSVLPSASAVANSSSSSTTLSSTSTSSSATPTVDAVSTSGTSVVFQTIIASQSSSQSAPSSSSTANLSGAANNGGSSLGKNTIIAIAVIGACVGGAVVIWTVIRKWKFAPSDEFGDRLNPIDWRPESDKDMAGSEKFGNNLDGTGVGHRRQGSRGSNRSFVSADAHSMRNTPTPAPGNMIPDLPAHDFTAGTNGGYGNGGLAPVGGYADLRRGPSPTPSMTMGDGYYRGYGATQFGGNNGY